MHGASYIFINIVTCPKAKTQFEDEEKKKRRIKNIKIIYNKKNLINRIKF